MIFEIKRTDSGRVIFSCEAKTFKECLEKAVSQGVDLSYANLSGQNLRNAMLYRSMMKNADFSFSDLSGARMSRSVCSHANFARSKMIRADVRCAEMSGADFMHANMRYILACGAYFTDAHFEFADLFRSNLERACTSGSSLHSAVSAEVAIAQQSIVPESGSFIGYKRVQGDMIVTLLIPEDAKRLNAYGSRKCRADKAFVLFGSGVSLYDENFEYVTGETVVADGFSSDKTKECAKGIHFFMTRAEAEAC